MKAVDLFCGCGGMSRGFENEGFDVALAMDYWKEALEVYQVNFNHEAKLHDLSNVSETIEIVKPIMPDMIFGGPPCQDFSSAGKRDVTLGRADLTYSYANIVVAVKPKWFVMENVGRITKSHILNDVIDQLSDAGYGMTAVILDASYCGVPQSRLRFFLIGELGGKHNQLLKTIKSRLNQNQTTMRDFFGDQLGVDYYYRHPRNYSRRAIFALDEPSPTIRGVNRPIPPGYVLNNGDPAGVTMDRVRPLTTLERSYVQTFPKSFKFVGTKTNLEQIIGNAVPVKMAEFVAGSINKYIANRDNDVPEDGLFEYADKVIIPQRALLPEIVLENWAC